MSILKLQQQESHTHPHKVAGWLQLKHGTNSWPGGACVLLQLMILGLSRAAHPEHTQRHTVSPAIPKKFIMWTNSSSL